MDGLLNQIIMEYNAYSVKTFESFPSLFRRFTRRFETLLPCFRPNNQKKLQPDIGITIQDKEILVSNSACWRRQMYFVLSGIQIAN